MKTAALGEIMLRLKSPGRERLLQSAAFEATFGGGEANVLVSLANFGMDTKFITALPDNEITGAIRYQLQGFGVDTSGILLSGKRVGVYYLEAGAGQRPSKVIYDREDSSMATASPDLFDFEELFKGCDTFFVTGITPAISESAAEVTLKAVHAAKRLGLKVACDLNYRRKLWKYGKKATDIMPEIARNTDIMIANEEAIEMCLGMDVKSIIKDLPDIQLHEVLAKAVLEEYPNVSELALTVRRSQNADSNSWQACLYDGVAFCVSRKYEMPNMVDRVGGGDSFAGGLLYSLNHYSDKQTALEFAVAASCLKHFIPGDFNRVSAAEAEALMQGDGSGRVQR